VLTQKNHELELKIKDLRQDKSLLDSKLMDANKKLVEGESLINTFETELQRERQNSLKEKEQNIQRQLSKQKNRNRIKN